MRRRLFTLLSGLSLVLCLAVAAIDVCSFFAFAPVGQFWGTYGNGNGFRNRGWLALKGSIHLFRHDRIELPVPPNTPYHFSRSGIDPAPGFQPSPTRFGFAYEYRVLASRGPIGLQWTDVDGSLSTPLWPLVILLALLPSLRLAVWARKRRVRLLGLCPRCGYDLRASPDRCPECGRAVPHSGHVPPVLAVRS